MQLFAQGLLIGVAIAAPVGPVGLLCIRRSILDGRAAGFVTGLGAATADACYGLIAALGVSAVTTLLLRHAHLIQLFGGAFMIYLGVHLLRSRLPSADQRPTHAPSLHAAYFSTFALTLANPITIVAFIGIFSALGIGLAPTGKAWSASQLVTGVFIGSCTWWLVLSSGASWVAQRINDGVVRIINYVSGGVIVAIGIYELVQLALQL